MSTPRRVVIESPYAGDYSLHSPYAEACLLDSLNRGEAPFASHILYPLVLDDDKPVQRNMGMEALRSWRAVSEALVVYNDLGISEGMNEGIEHARELGISIEYRTLKGIWEKEYPGCKGRFDVHGGRVIYLEEPSPSARGDWYCIGSVTDYGTGWWAQLHSAPPRRCGNIPFSNPMEAAACVVRLLEHFDG